MNASAAIKSARAYLNDVNGITWSDTILMPLLQEAHGEMCQELELNSVGVIKFQTAPILVASGALNLGTDQPSNIVVPISMMERTPGLDSSSFLPMERTNFVPEDNQQNLLRTWSWIQQTIMFIGATQAREVILRYEGTISTPQTLNDPLGFIFAERFLGPRVAELAHATIGKENSRLSELAAAALYKLLQTNVKADQRPVRRRAYRSPKGYYFGHASVPIGSGSGGPSVTWILPNPLPDGITTQFGFSAYPKTISWNGLNQFQGVGYTITASGSGWLVTFIDVNGNLLIPNTGDDIHAEIA